MSFNEPMPIRTNNLADRIRARVQVDANGCWIWQGGVKSTGYGAISVRNRMRNAYAVAYEVFKGTVPKGLELDHLCRVRLCVNPDHLEAVTHRENVLRGTSPAAAHAVKTHCPRGHEYAGNNLKVFVRRTATQRRCAQCHLESKRKSRHA